MSDRPGFPRVHFYQPTGKAFVAHYDVAETDEIIDKLREERGQWQKRCEIAIFEDATAIEKLQATLARERESRKQAEAQAQLHNDAAVEAIQRSQEYMAKYDKLVAEGWDELKKVAGERDKAFNAGIAMAADFANGFGCLMEIVPGETKADHLQRFMGKLVFAIRALTKPVQEPAERERGK